MDILCVLWELPAFGVFIPESNMVPRDKILKTLLFFTKKYMGLSDGEFAKT